MGDGEGTTALFIRPHDKDLPACLREKVDDEDLDAGAFGVSLLGLSCGDLHSSFAASIDEGAVDAALSLADELSVVELA